MGAESPQRVVWVVIMDIKMMKKNRYERYYGFTVVTNSMYMCPL